MRSLAAGTHLRSAIDSAEVIVVRGPSQPVEVCYRGVPLLSAEETADNSISPAESGGPGTLLGKRYVHEASGLELLCVKPGTGSLSANGEPLSLKTAKQLPASD